MGRMTYHHPRHPCAGTDAFLSERARRRIASAPRPPVDFQPAKFLQDLSRAVASMRPLLSSAPPTAGAMYERLRHHASLLDEGGEKRTDIATLTAELNLLPSAVPLLRRALADARRAGWARLAVPGSRDRDALYVLRRPPQPRAVGTT